MGVAYHLPQILLPSNSQWSYPKSVPWRLSLIPQHVLLAWQTLESIQLSILFMGTSVSGDTFISTMIDLLGWVYVKICCQCIFLDCINKVIHFDGINSVVLKDIWIKHIIDTFMYLRVPRKHVSQTNTITWHDGVHKYVCVVPLCTIYIRNSAYANYLHANCCVSCCFELLRSTFWLLTSSLIIPSVIGKVEHHKTWRMCSEHLLKFINWNLKKTYFTIKLRVR